MAVAVELDHVVAEFMVEMGASGGESSGGSLRGNEAGAKAEERVGEVEMGCEEVGR